jgi:hypothetical protein|eukprot:Stramenopile-MAST_4_protein_1945
MGQRQALPVECPQFYLDHAKSEFTRVLVDKSVAGLNLLDMLRMKPPPGVVLSFRHLGTLFELDSNHDGMVSNEELEEFVRAYYRKYRELAAGTWHDISVLMEGHFTYLLLVALKEGVGGIDVFVSWISDLLKRVCPVQTFASQPGVDFLHSDSLHALYVLLDVRTSYNIDFQGFLDLVQRAGEERGEMNLDDMSFDDVAPLDIVEAFVRDFAASMLKMSDDLSLAEAPV